MKTYTKKLTRVLDAIICDICGKTCTDDRYGTESASLEAYWGYGSQHDGKRFEIDICENCFYDTTRWMMDKRKEYQGGDGIPEPFMGRYYP